MADIPQSTPLHPLTSETDRPETIGITHDPDEQREIRRQIGLLRKRLPAVTRKYPRSIVPRFHGNQPSNVPLGEAMRWIVPWRRQDMPNKLGAMSELLNGLRAPLTIARYAKGARVPPPWVFEAVAAHVRQRCEQGMAIVAALEAQAKAPRPSKPGFRKVDPVTGLSGRVKAGHRRRTKEA